MVELASIIILGIFAQWLAWRVKLPAIFPLLLIGVLVGPIASMDIFIGKKLIDPSTFFHDDILGYIVSLSVGIILFEGGLTLNFKEIRSVAGTIRNLVTIGPFFALFGGAAAAHYFMGMDYSISLLFGALIIVTGPTVIAPILRNVRPSQNVATILKWESIIIDPIGALVAVLMYEFILSGAGDDFTTTALIHFGKTIFSGAVMGFLGAFGLSFMLKRKLIPGYLINSVSLAMVFVAFAGAEVIASESGLLSVTLMGMILANLRLPQISSILNFKESLTVLLVSMLFIILSANIDVNQMAMLGTGSLMVLLAVIFVLRPLAVFACTIGSNLTFNEKLFISWIGPRGIVAAAVASIFSIGLIQKDVLTGDTLKDAELLMPLTFLIIMGTVTIQGLTAKYVAKWLGVVKKKSEGFLILGGHRAAQQISSYLNEVGIKSILIDTSLRNINDAKQHGLKVVNLNVLSDEIEDEVELFEIGNFLALTPNNELNILACQRYRKLLNSKHTFRLITGNEMKFTNLQRPKYILFSHYADFSRMQEVANLGLTLKEYPIKNEAHLNELVDGFTNNTIPVFIKRKNNKIDIFPADRDVTIEDGDKLVYMGKDFE